MRRDGWLVEASPRAGLPRLATSIDVVIPVRDGWAFTKRCLEHLRDQTQSHAVVVCDNGSSDGTPGHVREAFPNVQLIELGANVGFSAACNRGVRTGTREIVVLLNNDVECRPDFLERLVAPFGDNRLGSVAALLLRPGTELIDSFGLSVDPTLAGYPRLRGRPAVEAQTNRPALAGPAGAAAAYRRSAWESVGGLDEGVFAYGEDVDLALRLRSAGWATTAAVDAVAVHVGSASAVHRSAWQRYQGGFARGYFLRRYGVLRGHNALRTLLTEAVVLAGDAFLYSHDLTALRGRIGGWRAASGLPRRQAPNDAIAPSITFTESLRLRRNTYTCT
jgi:N-acetylglucosaminyl-diphospho-decaprenol L-rhamnosyltransferase